MSCCSRIRTAPLVILLTLLALQAGGAWATTYRQLSLAEILDRTEIAFLGTVNSVTYEERSSEPWTIVEFAVDRNVLGPAEGRTVLAFLGGDIAGASLRVNLMPTFQVGERVLILAYDQPYISPIVGFDQGLWRLTADGLLDVRGRRLSLDDGGRLVADGVETEVDLLLEALGRELEVRQ